MILFFGPAGAGKSMQGQILAARHGWQWISTGKMFRETSDPEILKTIADGNLISDEQTNAVLLQALGENSTDQIILDGYPRRAEQAKWLLENKSLHKHSIDIAIVVEVPRDELMTRMQARGRHDDTPESIAKRLEIYHHEIDPILTYFNEQHIPVARVDGVGTVGQVHDRVEAELKPLLSQEKTA